MTTVADLHARQRIRFCSDGGDTAHLIAPETDGHDLNAATLCGEEIDWDSHVEDDNTVCPACIAKLKDPDA
jgi:hypothetical protein